MLSASTFAQELQKRRIETHKKLARIVQSTDYLKLTSNYVQLVGRIPGTTTTTSSAQSSSVFKIITPAASPSPAPPAPQNYPVTNTWTIFPLRFSCDTDAILDLLGDSLPDSLDLEDTGLTDIFIDVGSDVAAKINGRCVRYDDKFIDYGDISTILERLPGEAPSEENCNRGIFGSTLHRLATVAYNGVTTGITIRIGRQVLGLAPIFNDFVHNKNILICGSPNVGKTTMLRAVCDYLSCSKCLCLVDTSGEVCGDAQHRSSIVGTSRVFRPIKPDRQYATLLDCVRNHSPDIIAIDELNTKEEVTVCQTIALRSVQIVAAVHGDIQDLIYNPMLNKSLGGSTQALVSDRNAAVDGRKIVEQRTTRPIFDLIINIKRTPNGFEYAIVEDVADNVTRILQGKPVQTRIRRIVDSTLMESIEQVVYPRE
ncbi:hypothetical protein BGW41_003957 [Actinomortierella wolfii]|nr:hypothetical protein BGW41_003957 [Actinomortierella wolfii]